MANPTWPVYTFQVNLRALQRYSWSLPYRTSLAGNETTTEADAIPSTMTTWLANLFPGCQFIAESNAFEFTAYGRQAVYLKDLYVTGSPDDVLVLVS
jgi:hypothetical protein